MPSKQSRKRRGVSGSANTRPPRAQQPPIAVDAQVQGDGSVAAQVPSVQPKRATQRPVTIRRRSQSALSAALHRWLAANPWLAKAVGMESPLWVTLLLVIPILVIFLDLTVGIRLNSLPFVDVDYWWHIATGNWVLDHHRPPTTDPFSYTYGGKDWIAHEWLAEVMLALAVRAEGYAGAIILTTVFLTIGYWRLMAGLRYYGISRRAAVVLTLVWGGVFLRSGVVMVRPQVFTWALLAVLFAELAAYDTGKRKHLWVLPLLFAIWINMNLTALIGIGCLGAFVLDRLLRKPIDRHVVTVGVLSGLALLVNPHHIKILFLIPKYLNPDSVRRQYIFEWMPPRWHESTHIPFILALPMLLPAAWVLIRKRPMLYPAAPLVVLGYQSTRSIRYIPIFVMLCLIFAAWLVWRRAESRGTVPPLAGKPLIPFRPWVLAPAIAAAALAVVLAYETSPTQFRRNPIAWGHPVGAANFYLKYYSGERIFNTYDFGGYLIYRFQGTDNKVYIDGREEMYGEDRVKTYFYYIYGHKGWEEYFSEQKINVVIIRGIDGLFSQISESPNWKRVYQGNNQHVFIRESMPNPPQS